MHHSKRSQTRALNFPLFFALHLSVSLLVILVLKAQYFVGYRIIFYHLVVVTTLYSGIIGIGIVTMSFQKVIKKNIVKYLNGFLWGATGVLLYSVYLLAFLGKQNNGRTFTFSILFGYLKDIGTFAENTSLSLFYIIALVAIIPVLILCYYLYISQYIFNGVKQVRAALLALAVEKQRRVRLLLFVCLIFFAGFATAVLLFKNPPFYQSLIRYEEPLASVFSSKRTQGLFLNPHPESISIRKNYPKNRAFDKKNVIMIIVDALRADHLSTYGYGRKTSPFLDSLYRAGDLKKVKMALSSASGSFPGILSIIRSKSWHNMSEKNFSLPDLLEDQGYDLNFLVSGDHTHFYGLKSYYGDSFSYYIDGFETQKYTVNDDRLIFEGLANIPDFKNKPAYFHVHFNSAHLSGKKLEENKRFLPDQNPRIIPSNYINNYDNGVFQVDQNIKELFQILTRKGYLQNSLVVITGDHGESLGERGLFGHSKHVYTDETLIPLLIYDRDSVAYKALDFATQTDIAPTIINRLGLPQPPSWEGYSLLKQRPDAYSFMQMNNCYAIVHNKGKLIWKYIYNSKSQKEEFYELNSDLYERHNLIRSAKKIDLDSLRNMVKVFDIRTN